MKPLHALLLTLALGCGPLTEPPAKTWTVREFVANATQDKNFGGLSSRRLAVKAGDPIFWRSRPFEADDVLQGPGAAVPLWPAFAEGKTASILITEIWQNHPTPWVQPVYQFRTDGAPRTDLRGLFAVGVDSAFYTPYWRAKLANVPAHTAPTTYTSVPALLDANVPLQDSVMVVCPIVPTAVGIARPAGDLVAVRPLSQELVPPVALGEAWVDGTVVNYLAVAGGNRQTVTDRLPNETPMYFFVKTPGAQQKPFSLPPVLPDEPTRHSLHRRFDIALPAGAGAFVMAHQPELKALLEGEGVRVPNVDPQISDVIGRPYLLRVATNPSCFENLQDFPHSCRWLDSQDAVESAVGQDVRFRTEVLLTVSTLQLGAR